MSDEACSAGSPQPSLHGRRDLPADPSHARSTPPADSALEDAVLIDALEREIRSFGGFVKVNLLMMSKHLKRLLGRERKLLPILRCNPRVFSLSSTAEGDLFVLLAPERTAHVGGSNLTDLPETVSCRARALEDELRGLLRSSGSMSARELLRAGHVRKRLSPLVAFCPAKFGLQPRGSSSSKLCKFFASGRCSRGDACGFSHCATAVERRGCGYRIERTGGALSELDGVIGWLDNVIANTRAELCAFGRADRVVSAVTCADCSPLVDALVAFASARPRIFGIVADSGCACAAVVTLASVAGSAPSEHAETELRERVYRFLIERPHGSWVPISVHLPT
jgi:hypothetical protein